MNRFSQTSDASALTSRIRQERDVVATCVHLLGYWPRNSLVLMATDSRGVGPLIRVDLADPFETPAADYLDVLFSSIPQTSDQPGTGRRAFALIFGERVSPYPSNPRCLPTSPVTEGDQMLRQHAGRYLGPIGGASSRYDVDVLDVIAVGQFVYWAVSPETGDLEPVGWVNDIFSSPVYAELVSRGSVVSSSSYEAFDAKKWDPLSTNESRETNLWLATTEVAAMKYIEEKQRLNPLEPFQAEAELMLWNQVLEVAVPLVTGEDGASLSSVTLGDGLRALISPDAAGYLVASLTNSATLHYLVYLACTDISRTVDALGLLEGHIQSFLDDAGQSCRRLLPEAETLLAFNLGDLNSTLKPCGIRSTSDSDTTGSHFAGMLSGVLESPPDWGRLKSLELLCALFENTARNKCEALLIAAQAWVKWLRGNSTEAFYVLEGADQKYLESSPILLQSLLNSSAIPLWLTQPGGAPPVR